MANIIIPTPLRSLTKNQSIFITSSTTIKEAFHELSKEYPELGKYMIGPEGNLRSFITIYKGEENIRNLNKENTPLDNESVVTIVPAIAGGITIRGI